MYSRLKFDVNITEVESNLNVHDVTASVVEETKQGTRRRGTRRQQRYRAKQKLHDLCALASAQAIGNLNIEDTKEHPAEELNKRKKTRKDHVSSSSLPDYLNVPDRILKQMFISASQHVLTSEQNEVARCWLNNSANMQHTREQARLLDRLLFLQLQQSLWADYLRVGETDDVWASEVQQKMRQQVQMNGTVVASPLSFVTDYRQHIDEQLQRTENELNQHSNRFQQLGVDFSSVLNAFVRRGQHRLNAEFQSKKQLLVFDCQGHRLTKAFIDLKPTKEQVCFNLDWSSFLIFMHHIVSISGND